MQLITHNYLKRLCLSMAVAAFCIICSFKTADPVSQHNDQLSYLNNFYSSVYSSGSSAPASDVYALPQDQVGHGHSSFRFGVKFKALIKKFTWDVAGHESNHSALFVNPISAALSHVPLPGYILFLFRYTLY